MTIRIDSDGSVEAHWRRDYGEDGWSDARPTQVAKGSRAVERVLEMILEYEDEADRMDAIGAKMDRDTPT